MDFRIVGDRCWLEATTGPNVVLTISYGHQLTGDVRMSQQNFHQCLRLMMDNWSVCKDRVQRTVGISLSKILEGVSLLEEVVLYGAFTMELPRFETGDAAERILRFPLADFAVKALFHLRDTPRLSPQIFGWRADEFRRRWEQFKEDASVPVV